MGPYKRIERLIGEYIGRNYRRVVEVGTGENFVAAQRVRDAGTRILCTDIRAVPPPAGLEFRRDDVCSPDESLYTGADLIYAIRPGVEMVPALIALAERVDADLIIYHLGNEIYGGGGGIIDCGVILHRYHTRRGIRA